MTGKVYFIECAGRIKIGYAKDVRDRIRALSTGAAHNLTLLGTIDGSVHYERAIHARLKHLRQRGEWFVDCDEVRELMALLQTNGPLAIGFSEPPVLREKYNPELFQARAESPLKPAFERIEACTNRYLGEAISDALKQETALGMPKGSLANRRTGGFYTSERARVAFVIGDDTMNFINGLIDLLQSSIFDSAAPLDAADLVPPAMRAAEKYERGMQVLFSSSDPATLDLSGYAEAQA